MVGPSRGSQKNYQCPHCGREASEQNRYCSECFLVNPTQPGRPSTISLVMNGANNPGPVFTLQLVAVIAVGLFLVLGGLWAWNRLHPEVPPSGQDIQVNQPAKVPGGKTPPPDYPGGTTTRFDQEVPGSPTPGSAADLEGDASKKLNTDPADTKVEEEKTNRSVEPLAPPASDEKKPDDTTVKGQASPIPPQNAGKAPDQDLSKIDTDGEKKTETGMKSNIRE